MPDSLAQSLKTPHAETAAASVCVIIPTFRRPQGLEQAMRSVVAQAGISALSLPLSLIVCDNSPEASARAQVEGFEAAFPVIYIHEPKTGVANARNSAIKACDADFIAFLDDDEAAPAGWLARLTAVQARFDADVVFGPVEARLADSATRYSGYFTRFFSRFGPESSQVLNSYYGCGNSLIRRSALPKDHAPFSIERNDMGGEDDQLFHGLMTNGATLAWAADAPVFEDVPAARSRLGYTLLRAFAYGQGPSYTAAHDGKPFTAAAWMCQGVAQGLIFGLWGLALWLLRRDGCAEKLDKAARGCGKLIWFSPFKVGFYGAALLKPKPRGR